MYMAYLFCSSLTYPHIYFVDVIWLHSVSCERYVVYTPLLMDGAERSEAERREDPTDVAWITASTSQADHLSAPSVDNYVIFNG